MERIVEPEILDDLPVDDPLAVGSRKDLRLLNQRMRSAEIISRELRRSFGGDVPRNVSELGAGDGSLLLKVARALPRDWAGANLELLDRNALVAESTRGGFAELGWNVTVTNMDVWDWIRVEPPRMRGMILTNLFLHHFRNEDLRRLLSGIADRADLFLALEPRRSIFFMIVTRLLWVFGCNRVTRHDAKISVRAGFKGHELSHLWPSSGWRLEERAAGGFSHLFVARRASIS